MAGRGTLYRQSLTPAAVGAQRRAHWDAGVWAGVAGDKSPSLHFLIPPLTIDLRFGTLRRWSPGVEVDWRT